jgi:hypothetical protein
MKTGFYSRYCGETLPVRPYPRSRTYCFQQRVGQRYAQSAFFDLRARAEFLTYLVASQLLSKSVGGDWLTIENVVEFERIWLTANGGGGDWLERVSISSWSQPLAERVEMNFPVVLGAESAATMFSEKPPTRLSRSVCASGLLHVSGPSRRNGLVHGWKTALRRKRSIVRQTIPCEGWHPGLTACQRLHWTSGIRIFFVRQYSRRVSNA